MKQNPTRMWEQYSGRGVPKTGALVRRVSDVSGKLAEREVGGGEAPRQSDEDQCCEPGRRQAQAAKKTKKRKQLSVNSDSQIELRAGTSADARSDNTVERVKQH